MIPVVLGIDGPAPWAETTSPAAPAKLCPPRLTRLVMPAPGVVVYPVISLIGFKIVRKRRVGVRINDARAERKAVRVDVERIVERGRVGAIADKDDLIAVGADGIPGQNGFSKARTGRPMLWIKVLLISVNTSLSCSEPDGGTLAGAVLTLSPETRISPSMKTALTPGTTPAFRLSAAVS